MSNFTGITFSEQTVRPSDDATIRRLLLTDGFLYGCDLSYSGSTLTMGTGQLLACGRQFEHPAVQNWAVVDATSGYARLLLTIDLTKTATESTFEQITDTIEYASALDGFPELTQENVNVAGNVYQLVACVVSLGTGGITGIVEQLGACEASGGGGLNFKVVGNPQPDSPTNNTIWLNTDVAITSYDFSVAGPAEPVEGMVWITVGTSSAVEFNALRKNALQVYPLAAKQYVDGAWVSVEAMSYQDGEWVGWIIYYFQTNGEYVGEWGGYAYMPSGQTGDLVKPTTVKNADGTMTISLTATYNGWGILANSEKIDFSKHQKITFKAYSNYEEDEAWTAIAVVDSLKNNYTIIASSRTAYGSEFVEREIDVSNYNQYGYLAICVFCYRRTMKTVVDSIRME